MLLEKRHSNWWKWWMWQIHEFKFWRNGMLHQFHNTSDRSAAFRTALNEQECRGYGRNFHSSRPHTIEIHFCHRESLLLAAASESEAADWLSSMSQSEMVCQEEFPSRTDLCPPSACGVIVTDKNVTLFQSNRLLASVPLHTISLIMISQQDHFCLIVIIYRSLLRTFNHFPIIPIGSHRILNKP